VNIRTKFRRRFQRAFAALLAAGLAFVCVDARAGVDVRVQGLGADERDNAYSQIRLLGDYDPDEVQRLFEEGEQDIRLALQPYGWYNPIITPTLEGTAPDWTATYRVDAGPQTTITMLDIKLLGEAGVDEPNAPPADSSDQPRAALARVRDRLPLHVGDRLKHEDYESAKAKLIQVAVAAGYLDAFYSLHELRIDTDTNTASILLMLDTGPRYYFGDVDLQQDAGLDPQWLMRYVTIKPGAPFSSEEVLNTQFALSDLDYFTLVEIDPHKDRVDAAHRIPVTIRGQAKAPRLYRFGAGYGTDTGPRALLGAEFRHLNEQGHKLRIELRPSQRITTAIAEYKIPFGRLPGENIDVTAQTLSENVESIRENLYSLSSGYTSLHKGYQRHDYISYTNDRYTIQTEPERTSTLLTPGISYSLSQADDVIDPHRGWFGFLDVHGGSTYALSDTDFVQGHLKLRVVLPLGGPFRLYGRFEQGATFVSGFDTLPPSQRFFAGGDDSVRGYAYRSLAPHGPSGELVGGRYLSTGAVELGYDLNRHYGLALFGDAGGADDTPAVRLHTSVGIGLRYHAPFGSIAVDLAHPLDPGATPVRLHLGVRVGL